MDAVMSSYNFDYTILILRQAIDFAEIEGDFAPLRNWVNEVEESGHELGAMEGRLSLPAGQEVLMAALQSVATGIVSPEEALRQILFWLNNGKMQAVETELKPQYQFV